MKSNFILSILLAAVLLWTCMVTHVEPPMPGWYRTRPAETKYFQSLSDVEKARALKSRKRMEGVTEHIKKDTRGLAL